MNILTHSAVTMPFKELLIARMAWRVNVPFSFCVQSFTLNQELVCFLFVNADESELNYPAPA